MHWHLVPSIVLDVSGPQNHGSIVAPCNTGDSAHGARAEVRVVSLHHLNEIEGGMLLSGAADGSVRVWRHFSHRGAQRLTTAWRVCPAPQSSMFVLLTYGSLYERAMNS